ncbi:MAG TPA: choice-of-anchor tandem repeat GloVer-containing protein [Terriglobales bacterium]|nr:choice-of-anchor tandem repeat GloVer-containing protein [Terriglobales bacterium]
MHSSNTRNGIKDFAVFVFALLMLTVPLLVSAQTVYSFANPPDAFSPRCNLVVDTAGNMYGATFSGGSHNLGAVFKVTPSGTETVVYSFAGGADGSHPIAGLVRDTKTGNLYGTTVYGGATNTGTVFVLNPSTGVETVIYSFKGGLDGANPYSSVVRAGTTIFGTTTNGGAFGYGTVFKLTAAGKETVLHNFNSAFPTLDGSYPYGGLVLYKGILYGTTTLGGLGNLGTVFAITKTGSYTLLYNFKGGSNDGQGPNAGVAFDKLGNMFGTTYSGGINNAGVVYEISGGVETAIHHFGRNTGDGLNPYASLIFYKNNFYGTTLQGGSANGGTVFKITPSGTETLLHSFTGGADGFNPYSALLLNGTNTFYSTTLQGGTSNLGTVFKVIP